jgi:hypothetical protein
VYVSAGHGFTWTPVGGSFFWRTQRGNTNDIVEDLVTTETVHQWLIPMLQNAGARVFSVRESDVNSDWALVDDGEGGYTEQGAVFSMSSLMGWGRPPLPMNGDANPFTLGSNRLMTVTPNVTASATWTTQVPRDGYYEVSISYTAFSARVTDAHYVVRHAGGETSFRVNQQRHGGTWVTLGTFYFRANTPAQVVAQNDSTDARPGANVSLDAVKFGGGSGVIERGGGVSDRPRFEESARYHAQWSGAPTAVYAPTANTPSDDRTNDVGTRPRFAAWVHETGEPAVYISWHSNASNGTARGTQTYVYGRDSVGMCSLATEYAGVAGSRELADFVRNELVNDVRQDAGWNEPTWRDFGTLCANFGELNPANNPETPAILLELAFHDNATDAARLKEPQFRYLAARAVMQGIIRYFASLDQTAPLFPPEPPIHVRATVLPGGRAQVLWSNATVDAQNVGGAAATSYRVYVSDDGLAWDDGVETPMTTFEFSLPPNRAKYFRVSAVNAGGESFPSAVVGARAGAPTALIVNGFDRLEASMAQVETFAARYALNSVVRVLPRTLNDGSAVRIHGEALEAWGAGFESADDEGIDVGLLRLADYPVLSWVSGRGKAGGTGPSATSQTAVRAALAQGTRVLFSGEVGGSPGLLADLGGASRSGAGTRVGAGVGPLFGLSWSLDDGNGGTYDVGGPDGGSLDLIQPGTSGQRLASYATGTPAAVGVAGQAVAFGFPLEAMLPRATRIEVFRRALTFVFDGGVVPDAGVFEEPDGGEGGGHAGGGGAGGSGQGGAGGGENNGSTGGGQPGGAGGGDAVPPILRAFEGGGCSTSKAQLGAVALLVVVWWLSRKSARAP